LLAKYTMLTKLEATCALTTNKPLLLKMVTPHSLICPNLICHNFVTSTSEVGSELATEAESVTVDPCKK